MALIKCSECGTEVSDQAPACVKCGAPKKAMKAAKAKPNAAAAFIFLVIVGVIAIVIFASPTHHDSTSASIPASTTGAASAASDAVDAAASSDAAAAIADAASEAANSHNYALEQDGEYGYQAGISEDERKQGVSTKPLEFVRYKGVIDGAYTVDQVTPDGTTRMDCKDPCQYLRIRGIIGGQVVSNQVMQNNPNSLGGSIMADAQDGKLKVYKAQ